MASFSQRVDRLTRQFPWFGYMVAGLLVFFGPWLLNLVGLHWFFALLIWIAGTTVFLFAGAGHALMRLIFPKQGVPPPLPEPVPPTPAQLQAHMAASLPEADRERHVHLAAKCHRIMETGRTVHDQTSTASLDSGLERLAWLHLKMLLAKQQFAVHRGDASADDLRQKAAHLLAQENDESLSRDARASIHATRHLTEERLRRRQEQETRLTEIEADLSRIEAEVDLALDLAAMDSTHVRLGLSGSLAADVLQSVNWGGASLPQVQAVDRWHDSRSAEQ